MDPPIRTNLRTTEMKNTPMRNVESTCASMAQNNSLAIPQSGPQKNQITAEKYAPGEAFTRHHSVCAVEFLDSP